MIKAQQLTIHNNCFVFYEMQTKQLNKACKNYKIVHGKVKTKEELCRKLGSPLYDNKQTNNIYLKR